MPRFCITMTRSITESCVIEVDADSEDAACEAAHEVLAYDDKQGWESDDGSESTPYITGIEPVTD